MEERKERETLEWKPYVLIKARGFYPSSNRSIIHLTRIPNIILFRFRFSFTIVEQLSCSSYNFFLWKGWGVWGREGFYLSSQSRP